VSGMASFTWGLRGDGGVRADKRRIILETDAAAIAARVSRPKADATDIVINEQTLMNACE